MLLPAATPVSGRKRGDNADTEDLLGNELNCHGCGCKSAYASQPLHMQGRGLQLYFIEG
jgi:hypothetical protein